MFEKFKRVIKAHEGKQLTNNEWNEGLKRQGGLEKYDFLAMVIAASVVIIPVCLVLLVILSAVCCLFLL